VEGNRMKIINVKNTVKFPLSVFLIVLPETALYIVHPLYNPPFLLSPKIGPDLWTITRFENTEILKLLVAVFQCATRNSKKSGEISEKKNLIYIFSQKFR
jgi:hypothetical protein